MLQKSRTWDGSSGQSFSEPDLPSSGAASHPGPTSRPGRLQGSVSQHNDDRPWHQCPGIRFGKFLLGGGERGLNVGCIFKKPREATDGLEREQTEREKLKMSSGTRERTSSGRRHPSLRGRAKTKQVWGPWGAHRSSILDKSGQDSY